MRRTTLGHLGALPERDPRIFIYSRDLSSRLISLIRRGRLAVESGDMSELSSVLDRYAQVKGPKGKLRDIQPYLDSKRLSIFNAVAEILHTERPELSEKTLLRYKNGYKRGGTESGTRNCHKTTVRDIYVNPKYCPPEKGDLQRWLGTLTDSGNPLAEWLAWGIEPQSLDSTGKPCVKARLISTRNTHGQPISRRLEVFQNG